MTGVSGHMGAEALEQSVGLDGVEWVRILLTPKKRNFRLAKRLKRRYGTRLQVVFGDLSDPSACERLVADTDYVINMAAVIPPRSDAAPKESERCNFLGAKALTDAVKAMPRQAKFLHTSTIALYGCRNEKHPFCRVGDPLVISPYDFYSLHKLYGERYVLEAGLEHFVVLRQTAMLYPAMLRCNMSDGLMFHTCLNSPLEWVSARDSGYLIRRILERDSAGEVDFFSNRVYNLGGGQHGRQTGYDTFRDGFAVMGGSTEKFFRPDWLAARNFHGVWMEDGDELEALFGYQRDGVEGGLAGDRSQAPHLPPCRAPSAQAHRGNVFPPPARTPQFAHALEAGWEYGVGICLFRRSSAAFGTGRTCRSWRKGTSAITTRFAQAAERKTCAFRTDSTTKNRRRHGRRRTVRRRRSSAEARSMRLRLRGRICPQRGIVMRDTPSRRRPIR